MASDVKKKLAKVLALADSPIKAEADSALRKFKQLLIKYSLTEKDIEKEGNFRRVIKQVYWSGYRMPAWFKLIVKGVTSLCGCYSISEGQAKSLKVRRTFFYKYFFAGFEAGVVSAIGLFDYIVSSALAAASDYTGKDRRAFLKAFAVRIEERLEALRYEKDYPGSEEYRALVVSNLKEIEKQLTEYSKKTKAVDFSLEESLAAIKGQQAGKELPLNPQIT